MTVEHENLVDTLFNLLDEEGHTIALDDAGQIPPLQNGAENMIPLKDWAIANGISPATARQKAGRGALRTAHKVGRDWMISRFEPNIDHRSKDRLPAIEGPVHISQVLNYLLLLDGTTMPDTWESNDVHRDYCRDIFASLRSSMIGNERILFNLICEAMAENPHATVYFVPHADIIANIRDEIIEEADTIDLNDYLNVLGNIVHDLMSHIIDLKMYHSGQTIVMPWYKSVTWQHDLDDGLYFVPSDFFKLVFYGLGR